MTVMKKIGWGAGIAFLAVLVLVGGAVTYAHLKAPGLVHFPNTPRPNLKASKDPDVIARGRYLVHGPAHCAQCHSTGDREHPEKIKTAALSGGLEFAMGPLGTRYAPNLTPHETGIGKISDEDLARAIRSGVTHDGTWSLFMQIAAAKPSDEDIIAILSYLRSIPAVENKVPQGEWYAFGKVLLAFAFPPLNPESKAGPAHVPEAEEPSIQRGAYVAQNLALCTECHAHFSLETLKVEGPKAGGSMPEPSHGKDSDMEYVAPNLTSHATGMTGRLTEEQFLARLRAGRVFPTSIMPWENFQSMTESDMKSVYRYLKSLPPVDNDVGPTYRKIGWKPGDK